MESLREFVPNMEVYSVDEAFLELDNSIDNLDILKLTHEICNKVEKWVGIPLSIGIGTTKTLAKLANHMAKKNKSCKVFDLRDKELHNSVFSNLSVGKVWGIGKKIEEKLRILNINTAGNLRDSDPQMIRSKFSVVEQRIVFELRGMPCLDLETIEPRKNLTSSRSFGKPTGRLEDLEEALANYTSKAAIRLRKQKSRVQGIYIFICANRFSKTESPYAASNTKHFIVPTNDTMILISSAKIALKEIYNPKYQYQKVGITLLNIIHDQNIQTNLFTDKRQEQRRETLMATMDKINGAFNEEAIFIATQGTNRHWKMKSNMCSNCFTTKWDDLCLVG
jgi:DNA polymerase V